MYTVKMKLLWMTLGVMLAGSVASAQATRPAGDMVPVAPPASDASAGAAAADANLARPFGEIGNLPADTKKEDEELNKLLENMTPEQLDAIIKVAVSQRLKMERDQVKRELADNLLYEPDAVSVATALLTKDPADTQKDNIDRICKALSKADPVFGKAYSLYTDKKYKEAAEAFKKQLTAQESTYLSAARSYLYAESLARGENQWDAVDAYAALLADMPDRISFASAAAANAADIYEKMGRRMYALQMYIFCLKNYGLTLSKEEYDELFKRVETLQKIYEKPLDAVAGMMGDVKTRLDKSDSGKDTQAKEKEIVQLLEDLIKTAEEQQKGGGQSPKPKPNDGKGKGKGEKPGDATAQGQKPGQTRGTPSSPAMKSALVPGAVERPSKLEKKMENGQGGDWAELPPREKERLQEVGKKLMSERYRDAISDYRNRLAKTRQETSEK